MLFTCLPQGAAIPGRFPGPAHARGKWFSVDIHCHTLCEPARDKVRAANLPSPRHRHDSPATAAATAEHQERVLPQLLSLEQRLSGHGPDGDRRAGGLALARPDLLRAPGRSGDRGDPHGQRQHRRDLRQISRPFRRARHCAVPGAGARGRRAGAAQQVARPPRHRDRRLGRGRGFVGREILADLPEMRGARARPLHAPDRVYRDEPDGAVAPRQPDRQPARIDGRGASSDLWRGARRVSGPEAGDRAWRRVSAVVFGAHRPRRGGAARHPRCTSTTIQPY